MMKRTFSLALLLLVVANISAIAQNTAEIERAMSAITNALPSGWMVTEVKTNQIPYGHHWNKNYDGPTGRLVILKGTRPVHAEFCDTRGNWYPIHVATESLEIWIMPAEYHNSAFSVFDFHRPIQPVVVVNRGPVKVFGHPSHVLLSEQKFNEMLHKFNGVRWPDSPGNDPALLTWKDWRRELKKSIESELNK